MAPNYQNGKVYCVRNNAENDVIVYVGSTVRPLSERMGEHRKHANTNPEGLLHALMADVGISHFHIELLIDFPCERKEQLLAEEGRQIRLAQPPCNIRIAGRNMKEWYDENKTALIEKQKAYYVANKETVNAKKKERYAANKEEILAKNREYRSGNKEKIAQINKAYHGAHRLEILARQAFKRLQSKAASSTSES